MMSRIPMVVAVVAVGLGGCGGGGLQAYHKYDLGQAEPTVAAAVEFLGGIEAWNRVSVVHAEAVMTLYDEQGQPYANSQIQQFNVKSRRLTIKAATAQHGWTAVYGWGDHFWLFGASALGRITPERLHETMAMLSHRLAGPLNLLGKDERPGEISRVTIGGKDLVRIAAAGKKPEATAYYFDADSGKLDMVTAGSETPGEGGTVTLYTYQMLPDGLVFPKTIRVVKTGRHTLEGSSAVMEVEYSNVRID
jgi:hypothetical protein